MPRPAPPGESSRSPGGAARSRYGRNVARDRWLVVDGDRPRRLRRLLRRRRGLGLGGDAGQPALRRVGLLAVDGDVADRELFVAEAELDAEPVLEEHPEY